MRAFAEALASLSDEDLIARYDPAAMDAEQVYLSDVFVDEGEDGAKYVMQGIPALRRMAADCVATGRGAIKVLA